MVDPNEISGFISACTNSAYLMQLRDHLTARLVTLGVPAGVLGVTPPAGEQESAERQRQRAMKTGLLPALELRLEPAGDEGPEVVPDESNAEEADPE